MNQSQANKRRRRLPPPARLGWPSSTHSASPSSSQHDDNSTPTAMRSEAVSQPTPDNHKNRKVTFEKRENPSLWTEKHAPSISADLVIAPKKLKEVSVWMQSPSSRILILVGKPGIGKSTMVRMLARELGLALYEWAEPTAADDSMHWEGPPLLEMPGPLASFERFLQQMVPGFKSIISEDRSINTTYSKSSQQNHPPRAGTLPHSVLLLDNLPNLHGPAAEQKFRDCIRTFLEKASSVHIILIFSDVVEGKANPDDLERLIDRSILYSPQVIIQQIHPPTAIRLRKVLEKIVKQEKIGTLSSDFYDELCVRCAGDLRFAIMTLQYEQAGLISTRNKPRIETAKVGPSKVGRDEKLSTFHALGKLLYAKRATDVGHESSSGSSLASELGSMVHQRPALQFTPENVIDQCDMNLGGSIYFLQYHCPAFFTELEELSETLDSFSDAAVCLDRPTTSESSIFPDAYAGSLAARAVATHNLHPAPWKYRQFHSPVIFEVLRKRDSSRMRMQELMSRWQLCIGGYGVAKSSIFGVWSDSFISECLHYLKHILSDTESLPTLPTSRTSGKTQSEPLISINEQKQLFQLREQEEVLRLDDIDDYASDNDYMSTNLWLQDLPAAKKHSLEFNLSQQRENIIN